MLSKLKRFSIHKRIEGGATFYAALDEYLQFRFQYPQADRRGCNKPLLQPPFPGCVGFSIHKRIEGGATNQRRIQFILFQLVSVSTSGSKGVQLRLSGRDPIRKVCFSIHKRIEGGATGGWAGEPAVIGQFQYPQADRRGCNGDCATAEDCCAYVSVSTSGSKGVQHSNFPLVFNEFDTFQYPQADRRGCNGR